MATIALRQTSAHASRASSVLLGLAGAAGLALYAANDNQSSYKYSGSSSNGNNNNNNNNNKNNGGNYIKALFGATTAANINNAMCPEGKKYADFQEVYNDIAKKVRDEDDADRGAGRYGLLVRLSWHASGTYNKKENSGGSYGGTMIYSPESTDGANAGLEVGRDFLAEIGVKYPWISRGDLWTLGGVVGVQEAGGPKIPWRPGRVNATDESKVPANGRLPDASQGASHIRDVFGKYGFTDEETVALIGAHCLGRCHTWRSGFDGPWGPSPNMFNNAYYVELLKEWRVRDWNGPKQYEDVETKEYMMLPSDMALKEDSVFVKSVKKYAANQDLFFADFTKAYVKLLENGCTYPRGTKYFEFKTLDEQEN
ncbi:hypothetical protein PUMCH_002646 [Australozyma saopauloensis]|uniref:Peroxidase n=1 Tax=Australozyma saopauloensis TaxID=291208 RepID=A0AAX4HC29_9ASCO|nr:hypothetical protein PUMCH_002646 [[Candida] saopauloensis]